MRNITEQGLSLIKTFEGFRAEPYLCPAGYWTIGYGHLLRAEEGLAVPLSRMAAETLLRQDVAAAEAAVLRHIRVPLSDGQFDALVSFTFNLGAGALQRSTLRRKVNRDDHAAVPQELMRWVYAGGRRLPGLTRRRAAEAACYAEDDNFPAKSIKSVTR